MYKTLDMCKTLAVIAALGIAGAFPAPAHAYKSCCDWGEPNGISLTGAIADVSSGKIEIFTIFPR